MSKTFKCSGCGVILQDENLQEEGYTTNIQNKLCMRCFRLKHYGEYQVVTKSNDEYIQILRDVSRTRSLVLYVVDILDLEKELDNIRKYINNNTILVLSKIDVLPKSTNYDKLIRYINEEELDFLDIILTSSFKNYNIDYLLKRVNKLKKTKRVFVVGNTNSGKSTLINKIIKNHSINAEEITISPLPSTTLNTIDIKVSDDLTLVDTPGLVDYESIINHVDTNMLKKLTPKSEIKPKTYQLRKGQCLIIENIVRIDYIEGEKNSFTIYMSNDLKIKRLNASKHDLLKDLSKRTLDIKYHEDIVIKGLGFIKIVSKALVDVYIDIDVGVYQRSNLI